ncbi:MAG: hypothetical protein K2X49_03945 [Acetobacteraceae bacterium]|nr:hypothetical protein [Acetobacteraceae bacterium]
MAIAITAQHGAAGQRTEGESAGGQAERERGHGAGLPAGVDAVAVLTGVAAGAWTGCGDNRRVDVLAGLPRLPEYVPGRRRGGCGVNRRLAAQPHGGHHALGRGLDAPDVAVGEAALRVAGVVAAERHAERPLRVDLAARGGGVALRQHAGAGLQAAEGFFSRLPGLTVQHGGTRAFYAPATDQVQMPASRTSATPRATTTVS